MPKLSRRHLLAGTAGVILGSSARWSPAAAQEQALRLFWWGSQDRADRTNKVAKLFEASRPGVRTSGEFLGFDSYQAKLATQVAGRNAPDVIQTEYRFLHDFARRGALRTLDDMVGSTLNVSDFAPAALDTGRVDGKLYAVPLGLSALALIYDETAFKKFGIAPPTPATTWEQQGEIGLAVTKAAKAAGMQGYYGLPDEGGGDYVLEVWVTQRGGLLYTPDGQLGFQEPDLADWFAYWDGLRKSGACVTPDIQALNKQTIESMALTLGKAAVAYAVANQLVGFQAVNKGKLGITTAPSGGPQAKPGQALRPSQFFSIYAGSKNPTLAGDFINFFTHDPEAAAVLGVERGPPGSAAVRQALLERLDETSRSMVDYISLVSKRAAPPPPPPPNGSGEVSLLLRRTNEQVGFGRLSPSEAAKSFMREASAVLARR
jgi:multiple sugar transport system substrate-binding protein